MGCKDETAKSVWSAKPDEKLPSPD